MCPRRQGTSSIPSSDSSTQAAGVRSRGSGYLGACRGFAAALQTHKHDDVGLALGGLPWLHAGIQELLIRHAPTHSCLAKLVENGLLDDAPLVEASGHLFKVDRFSKMFETQT